MLAPILKLGKLQLRAVAASLANAQYCDVGWFRDETSPLPVGAFGAVLLADLLERKCVFLSAEQKRLVLETQLEYAPPGMIAFADGAYCVWDGLVGYLDLETGDVVPELPAKAVETIGYNLVALRERALNEIAKRQKKNGHKHSARSVEEPGDVCDSPADVVS
jgi:hypothetical protein